MALKVSRLVGGSAITLLSFAALAAPASCASDDEDCAKTQTCIDQGDAGGGGEDPGNGGSSGSGKGGTAGSSGKGGTSGSSGKGGTSGSSGAGGSAGTGGTGASDTGGAGGDLGGAGTGAAGMGGEAGGEPDPDPDTTPPTIISVQPANGATGVAGDQAIVITFSEPMSPTVTANAFQSTDIPNTTVTWNQDFTRLILGPIGNLAYATGGDPNTVVARTYAVMMTDNAVDAAGNRMADDYAWSFRTQRRISQTLLPAPATGSDYWALTQAQDPLTRICPAAGADFGLGEINAPGSGLFGRIFIAIRVTELPTGILRFLTANLSANQTSVVQAYGDSNLGVIHASHVSLPLTTNPYPTIQGVSTLRDLGIFSSSPALGVKNLDVAVALTEDYAQRSQRGNTSQYVLAFDKYSDDGATTPDAVRFDCSSVQLDVTYMIP